MSNKYGRGYFAIGIYHTKTPENVGTLWRSAMLFGAAYIFTIGHRYQKQASDTPNTALHIPLFSYDSMEQFQANRPRDCVLIAVEQGGRGLAGYGHPQRGIYLLGAEDYGLPDDVVEQCDSLVTIEAVRSFSFNVAIAGSIVMYDRLQKSLKDTRKDS